MALPPRSPARAAALLLFVGVGCAPDYDDVATRMVGVGYDPQEVGPSPTPYGGVLEYSWVNFAGAGLSPGLLQLTSHDEVGPGMAGFGPPYAAVYGFSYVFDQKMAAADALAGLTSVPPEADDSCYTTFEATGPIGSFTTVDVGTQMTLLTADGLGGMALDRSVTDYPADPEDVFVYYIAVDHWTSEPAYGAVPGDSNLPQAMTPTVVRRDNFPFGEDVSFRFPGGFPPKIAPVASIPRPAASAGLTSLTLPDSPGPVALAWTGPRYDRYGRLIGSGDISTCLAWPAAEGAAPEVAEDCVGADTTARRGVDGQIYTGPWDAEDGAVTFRWVPGGRGDEAVSLAVRFLGPTDVASPDLLERVVEVPPDDAADDAWRRAQRAGTVPSGMETPTGRRAAMPCETDATWELEASARTADGALALVLRGDPAHNVAELTCRLADDGEFTLTREILADALIYAQRSGAEGAVFTFARGVEAEAALPAARDRYGQRLDISPMKLTSRAIDLGRFWYDGEGR